MRRKRLISTLVTAATLLSSVCCAAFPVQKMPDIAITASADTLTTTDYQYTVNEDGSTVTLTKYTGTDTFVTVPSYVDGMPVTALQSTFYDNLQITGAILPNTLVSMDGAFNRCTNLSEVYIPYGVTTISRNAFCRCSSLTTVDIPGSVTSIGQEAFSQCTNLSTINIPVSVTEFGGRAFYETQWLANRRELNPLVIVNSICVDGTTCSGSVTIPQGVTSIADNAFYYGNSITDVTIPNGVTRIGTAAFYQCPNLRTISIPSSVTSIGRLAFEYSKWLSYRRSESPLVIVNNIVVTGYTCSGDIVIPSNITSICNAAFANARNLKSITIPASVTYIEPDTFLGCSSLTTVNLPNNLTGFGEQAFSKCTSLQAINIPSGVTSIPEFAFNECSALAEVTIPNSVTSIGRAAFTKCTSLRSFTIPYGITSIESGTFSECTALTDVTLGENVTTIQNRAFEKCTSLTTVNLPDSLKIICGYAFDHCTGMQNIDIPEGVTTIEDYAFSFCRGLESFTVPESVTSIDIFKVLSFYSELRDITIKNRNCQLLGSATYPADAACRPVLHGHLYSTAHSFANKYGITFVALPDQPLFTAQPQDVSAAVGSNATFSVSLGLPSRDIQWQRYNAASAIWEDFNAFGSKTETLTIPVTAEDNGRKYRCVVTNSQGVKYASSTATLTVLTTITAQPRNASAPAGDTVQFTIEATGPGMTYQWQYFNTDQNKWRNTNLAGNKTPTLTVTSYVMRHNMKYKCLIRDANNKLVISSPAVLRVTPKIVSQTESPFLVKANKHTTISVEATGIDLIYQWQYFNIEQNKWMNTIEDGNKTPTLDLIGWISKDDNGNYIYQNRRYRCIVKDSSGNKVYSKPVKMNITPSIDLQPYDITETGHFEHGKGSFSIAAFGIDLIYQWQYYDTEQKKWLNTYLEGYNTSRLMIPITQPYYGMKFKCIVKDRNGFKLISNSARVALTPYL